MADAAEGTGAIGEGGTAPLRRLRKGQRGPGRELFGTDRPGGLHERVYRSLVHAIASGRFEQGTRLPSEPDLAATFAVSRPVVRQALDLLRKEGLIASQRGSGTYVLAPAGDPAVGPAKTGFSVVEIQTVLDDLEFRLVVEPEGAALAARRRTDADLARMDEALLRFEEAHAAGAITHHFDFLFHEAIALATTNGRFVDAVRSLEYRPDDPSLPVRHLAHFRPSRRAEVVLREHRTILELIRARNGNAARSAMWTHIRDARLRLTSLTA